MMQNVNHSDWTKVDEAFDFALSLPESEQLPWVDLHFSNQPDLRLRTRLLLTRAVQAEDLFETLGQQRDTLFGACLPESFERGGDIGDLRIGVHYGPWKIVARIGAGGLAEVYEVERDDDRYHQKAALKIMRASMLNGDALTLFNRERRVLASLDHPGLVRIIDGGETATGAPWLVMEHVAGVPITRWCDDNKLAMAARLTLLAEAADALQAAHGGLVLHGDIKPDHVVVANGATIKLLDFGIAQMLDSDGNAGTAAAVTPAIASPEQRVGAPMTTASDIYQLGLIVQEVLAPCKTGSAHQAVIAMALASGAAKKYASAAEVAADLRHLMADHATIAQPDSRQAFIARFLRHNRMATIFASMILLGLIGWGVSASLYVHEIETQRNVAVAAMDRAEKGRTMLLNLFRRADPLELDAAGPPPAGSLKMLDSALADARRTLSSDPELIADLMGWTARAHQRADDLAGAQRLASEAVNILQREQDPQTSRYVAALAYLGYVQTLGGDQATGRQTMDRAMTLLDTGKAQDKYALDALLVAAWSREGDWVQQKMLFTRALQLSQRLKQVPAEVEAGAGLGRSLTGLGQADAAQSQLDRALVLAKANYGEGHPRLALVYSDLGRLASRTGQPDVAIQNHRQALNLSIAAFGPNYSGNIAHRNNLATALSETSQFDEAIVQLRQVLEQSGAEHGTHSLPYGEVLQNLGAAQVQAGKFDAAERALGQADLLFAEHLRAGHLRRAFPSLTRAELRIAQSRFEEAEVEATRAYALLSAALPDSHFITEVARCRIGIALIGQGKADKARPYVHTAFLRLKASKTPVPARYSEPCRKADMTFLQ